MNLNNKIYNNFYNHIKYYGYIYPSSEIYNGLNGIYDYGPYGIELKNNIKELWWKSMVKINNNIIGLDTSILMNEKVWKYSGHLDHFYDIFIKDKNLFHKIDNIINNNLNLKIFKINYYIKKKQYQNLFIYLKKNININKIIKHNLMYKVDNFYKKNNNSIYLRPETAQGTFINFNNFRNNKIPFGVAQIGKVFRNEINTKRFLFKMKEFEQMEMQYFIEPNTLNYWYKYWINYRMKWHLLLKLGKEKYRFKTHKNLAHYCNKATDIEFLFDFGFKELEGIHSRTDYDLSNHSIHSNKVLNYFDSKYNIKYKPYVIETSLGLDRLFYAILLSCYYEQKINNRIRYILKIPYILAPIKAAILPLINKNGMPELALKIYNNLKWEYNILYNNKDSIGKRYREQDAIGTPFCITIDNNTIHNNIVSIRYRDSMKQIHIPINYINKFLYYKTNINLYLKRNFNIL